ncbi:hypothetical protein MKW92_046140, partial [Papaver armeniacum]
WRLHSGDATTFILAEFWEICAKEQEHKQWLPKPTEVNLIVCTDAHLKLNVLTSEAYGRFSISKGVSYYVEKHFHTRHQNFNVTYFYMPLTQIPSYRINFSKVYFFQYIFLLTYRCTSLPTAVYIRFIFDRGKEMAPVGRCSVFVRRNWNGLIFTDASTSKYSHELILEFGYHFIRFLGVLIVLEFVITGERCDASQLVYGMSQQDYIPRFI